jgi:DNA-binding LytR/AlgR family response regulator
MNFLNPKRKKDLLLIDEVILMQASINYTIIHLHNGQQITSSYTLKFHEKNLQNNLFVRVNKTFLLNQQYISGYSEANNVTIVHLKNGLQIPVSRRRKPLLKLDNFALQLH